MEEVRGPLLPRSQVTTKTVLTVALTLFGLAVLCYLVSQIRGALTLIVIAALLATALERFVRRLMRAGASRNAAIAMVMTTVVAIAAVILLALVPPAVRQVNEFVASAPQYLDDLRHSGLYRALDARFNLDAHLDHLRATLPSHLQNYANVALSAVSSILSALGAMVTIFFLVIFMLAFGRGLVRRSIEETLPQRRGQYQRIAREIYRSVGGYIGALGFVCLTNAVGTTTFLAIIGNPFFLPLGILSGLSSLVPLVGNTIAGILISLVSWATGGLWRGVATVIYYIVYQQFENHVLGPVVYRRAIDLNPLVAVIALLCFADFAGIVGAVLAIPIVAVLQIALREVLTLRRERLGLPPPGAEPARPRE